MRDRKLTIEEFLGNDCYSAKHFRPHIEHFLSHAGAKYRDIGFQIYRHKMVVWSGNKDNGNKLVLKPHFGGRSEKYMRVLKRDGKTELLTVRCDVVTGEAFMAMLRGLLAAAGA